MKLVPLIVSSFITCTLVFVLNNEWRIGGQKIPAFGKFLSPQHGFWKNAEPTDFDFSADLKFTDLKGKVDVYLDERLIPHVFAEVENDAYFVQGYLHAKFRLWQMELQTHAAAGRLSEIIGKSTLQRDREFRRLGMVYAAENSLKELEKDKESKAVCDAYTAGVNAYINSLSERELPLEYKLIGYKPELWSNLKTVLFMKYMSHNLASHEEDFEMTNAKVLFNPEDFAKLFPSVQDSLDPIIPKGTPFEKQKIFPVAPSTKDSIYLTKQTLAGTKENKADKANGSNNWAVSGKLTKSGAPILCNDPHLGLNLPAIWYEIQISTPTMNLYGASFPGAPGVMIGFNDSCAFGFTNGGRDIRDYYEIKFKDKSRNEYWYNQSWQKTKWRIETLKIAGSKNYIDSVAYVNLGGYWCPVMYDNTFDGNRSSGKRFLAVRWKAHDPSNELKMFSLLNHAKNYNDYSLAIANLETPGQNCVFACKNGDIAIKAQGKWPAKWKEQGDYIMPGTDSTYLWQGIIPQDEVPFQFNPERGFVSSANQKPADDNTYPYYLGRSFPIYRGLAINRKLKAMKNITVNDMMALQTDNYNVFAEVARPLLMSAMSENRLKANEKGYFELLKNWNLKNDIGSKGATVFELFWERFFDLVFEDEYAKMPAIISYPDECTLLEGIIKDKNFSFLDNVKTTGKTESLSDMAHQAFTKTAVELAELEEDGELEWEKYKGTQINHLAKLPAFARKNLAIGGGSHNINATKATHGASWRMIVSLTNKTEAFGVYPGGQSGNPGSKFYDNFIDQWTKGKYYSLWMMTNQEKQSEQIKWVMNFSKN
jgi:penicillin amidase